MLIPPRYFIRSLKAVLHIALVFLVVFAFIYLFAEHTKEGMTFVDFVATNRWQQMIMFIVLFGFTYPMVAFYKKVIYPTKPFAEQRSDIENIFTVAGYELISDDGSKMEFRLKNKFHQLMRLFKEDTITVDYGQENLIEVSGLRKDAYRLGKHIEYLNRLSDEEV